MSKTQVTIIHAFCYQASKKLNCVLVDFIELSYYVWKLHYCFLNALIELSQLE